LKKSTPRSRRTGKRSVAGRREPPRLVLDTNVLVSALLWTGPPHELLHAARTGTAVVVTSPALIEELRDVLARPKLAARLAALGTSAGELMESLLRRLVVVKPATVDAVIAPDPDDDQVLACAVAGKARWIVSGDAHLLALKRHKRTAILTPTEALLKLRRARRQRVKMLTGRFRR
jgi:putative PIN family toxin of toxin-antitoxin system